MPAILRSVNTTKQSLILTRHPSSTRPLVRFIQHPAPKPNTNKFNPELLPSTKATSKPLSQFLYQPTPSATANYFENAFKAQRNRQFAWPVTHRNEAHQVTFTKQQEPQVAKGNVGVIILTFGLLLVGWAVQRGYLQIPISSILLPASAEQKKETREERKWWEKGYTKTLKNYKLWKAIVGPWKRFAAGMTDFMLLGWLWLCLLICLEKVPEAVEIRNVVRILGRELRV